MRRVLGHAARLALWAAFCGLVIAAVMTLAPVPNEGLARTTPTRTTTTAVTP